MSENDESQAPVTAQDTEVVARKRRTFNAAYKRQIVEEASRMMPDERGALLRREGLYSSHLSQWQAELGRNGKGLTDKKRGPKANPEREQVRRLEREKSWLEKRLHQAELKVARNTPLRGCRGAIIGAQKKLAELFGTTLLTEEEILGHKRDR